MSNDFKNQMQAVIKRGMAQPQNQTQQHQLQGGINDEAKRLVDKVFEQLKSIFPAWQYAWKDAKAIDAAKVEWVKAFLEGNVNTIDQLREGFKHARASESDFLPSSGKFVQWCNKSVCDPTEGYIRFVNRKEPQHPVEIATRGEVGFNCRSVSAEKAEKIWNKHYKINYQKWVDGQLNKTETPLLTEHSTARPTDIMRSTFKPTDPKVAARMARLNKNKAGKK
tara:strand:+ start:2216 stop:2884 length:669 start_codon:yes stop_codon:yes gene_type:complete